MHARPATELLAPRSSFRSGNRKYNRSIGWRDTRAASGNRAPLWKDSLFFFFGRDRARDILERSQELELFFGVIGRSGEIRAVVGIVVGIINFLMLVSCDAMMEAIKFKETHSMIVGLEESRKEYFLLEYRRRNY